MGLGQSGMGKVGGVVERERAIVCVWGRKLLNRDRYYQNKKRQSREKENCVN
jgi:uridine kinase